MEFLSHLCLSHYVKERVLGLSLRNTRSLLNRNENIRWICSSGNPWVKWRELPAGGGKVFPTPGVPWPPSRAAMEGQQSTASQRDLDTKNDVQGHRDPSSSLSAGYVLKISKRCEVIFSFSHFPLPISYLLALFKIYIGKKFFNYTGRSMKKEWKAEGDDLKSKGSRELYTMRKKTMKI